MKKIYTRVITLSLISVTSIVGYAQTDEQVSKNSTLTNEVNTIVEEVESNIVTINQESESVVATCTNVLNAPVAGGNNFDGNMFDITANTDVIIETFAVTVGTNATIEIYARAGSFVGNNTNSAGWTLVGTGNVVGAGVGNPVEVPVDIAYAMSSGSTHAFYVTANAAGTTFSYTNGTAVGNTWASNADLVLKEGNGGEYPFNVTFSPRNFNGNVIYCLPTGINETLNSSNVSVYPNPAKDVLNISIPVNEKLTNIVIYDVLGKIILEDKLVANGTISEIDITNLKSGMYIVRLQADGVDYSTKLLVD
ncbi:MAG: T9SS type A sorting domain-containing protein [Vicingaceae bacterium]|nr:T9SS type A sorting domain-containing protein [Vicingaceae bacterium]